MSRGTKVAIAVLTVLVLLSLALNGVLIWQWLNFRAQALVLADQALAMAGQAEALRQGAIDAIAGYRRELRGVTEFEFEYNVQIDQTLPIDAVVPFHERLEVPIQTTIPIDQEIQTTVNLQIPQFGLDIPVDVAVPIQVDVPIDLKVPVEIDRDVPIQTTVPISLEVPISIDLADAGLLHYVDLVDQGLADLERMLTGLELSLPRLGEQE